MLIHMHTHVAAQASTDRGGPQRGVLSHTHAALRAVHVVSEPHTPVTLNYMVCVVLTLAGLEPAIFGSEDQRLIH